MNLQGVFLGCAPKSFKTKAGVEVHQTEVTVRDDSVGIVVCVLPGDFAQIPDLSRVTGQIKGFRFNPFQKRVEPEMFGLTVVPATPEPPISSKGR